MSYKELTDRIKKNFKILSVAKIAGGIFSALTLLLIGRSLGVEKFGIFSMVISAVEICNILLSFRIWDTTVKFIGQNLQQKNVVSKYLTLSFHLSLASSTISFLAIYLITNFYAEKLFTSIVSPKQLIFAYSFVVLFITLNEIMDGILRVFDNYTSILKINIYQNLLRFLLVGICLILVGLSIQNVINCFVFSYIVGFFLRFFYLRSTLKLNNISVKSLDFPDLRLSLEFIKFMLNAHFSNILNIANDKNLGVIAVGYLTTPYYAGLYRAARAIVKIIRRIIDPLLEIIFPELVKLYSEKKFIIYKKIIYDSTKLVLLVSLVMGGVIFYFSNSLIVIFFGQEYIEAVFALRILIGAMIIHNLAYWVNPTILSSGNAKFLTISTITTTVIYCISLFYFIQQASHEGAAIALLIKNLSTLLLGLIFYFKFLKNKI